MFFSNKEKQVLILLALTGLASYLSGLDYLAAKTISNRTPLGISLFFSYWYYIALEITASIILFAKNRKTGATVVLSILLLSALHTGFTKYLPRERPSEAMPIGNKLMEKIINFGATGSFFSGHAASAVATYTGYLLINYHPNIILALILPIITSRITLAHHYISDVIGGIIFGYVTTKLVYHTINKPPKNRLI